MTRAADRETPPKARLLPRPPNHRTLALWIGRLGSLWVSTLLVLPLWRGGWLLFGDHAPHIAEVLDLASHESGWSDLAYAGFPLGVLHSPLWYGLLARLVRVGAPAWASYCAAVTFAECALGLSVFEVARRRASEGIALLGSVLVQTQSLLVTGPSGVLSGMWTFGLATAMFFLLVDRVHEPTSLRIGLQIAAIVAGIGLTHTFAIHAVVALVVVRSAVLLVSGREGWREAAVLALACGLGAIASTSYWLAALLSIDTHDIQPVVSFGWPNFQIFFRPWLDDTFDPIGTVFYRTPELPDLVLVLGAALGFLRFPKLGARERTLLATTIGTVALVLFVVSHIATMPNRAIFGPIPWRIMVVVRGLLLFSALAALPPIRAREARAWMLALMLGAVSVGWGNVRSRLLAQEMGVGATSARAEVEELFSVVAHLAPSIEGRVYVQNTHGIAPPPLGYGHALALLPARAGVRAVGSYYSLVPFPTDGWLNSFVGPIVGQPASETTRETIEQRLDDLGAELVVLHDPATIAVVSGWQPRWTSVARAGRFTVFRRLRPGLARSEDPGARVEDVRFGDGELTLTSSSPTREVDIELAIAFARRWQIVEGPTGSYLARRRNGLMRLHLPAGEHRVVLRYREPRWPLGVSALGWNVIALGLWISRRRRAVK